MLWRSSAFICALRSFGFIIDSTVFRVLWSNGMGILLSSCSGPKQNILAQETKHARSYSDPFQSSYPTTSTLVTASPGSFSGVLCAQGKLSFLKSSSPDASRLPSDSREFAFKRPCLSEEDQNIVLGSWQIIKRDVSSVGTITFISLFAAFPELSQLFSKFYQILRDSIGNSVVFTQHILLVMACVEKTIERLQERNKLESLLHDIGEQHRLHGVKRVSFVKVIPFYMDAIRPSFDNWTEELERAWLSFMQMMCHVVCEKLHSA